MMIDSQRNQTMGNMTRDQADSTELDRPIDSNMTMSGENFTSSEMFECSDETFSECGSASQLREIVMRAVVTPDADQACR